MLWNTQSYLFLGRELISCKLSEWCVWLFHTCGTRKRVPLSSPGHPATKRWGDSEIGPHVCHLWNMLPSSLWFENEIIRCEMLSNIEKRDWNAARGLVRTCVLCLPLVIYYSTHRWHRYSWYSTLKNKHRRTNDIAKKFWKTDAISDDIGKLQKHDMIGKVKKPTMTWDYSTSKT